MKVGVKVAATVLAAALVVSQTAAPASAFYKYHYMKKKKVVHNGGSSSTGKFLVACIMGSALGLITSAYLKKTGQLTIDEAQLIAFSCGLGAFPVIASFKEPTVVRAAN
jgi:hypothetical protein